MESVVRTIEQIAARSTPYNGNSSQIGPRGQQLGSDRKTLNLFEIIPLSETILREENERMT